MKQRITSNIIFSFAISLLLSGCFGDSNNWSGNNDQLSQVANRDANDEPAEVDELNLLKVNIMTKFGTQIDEPKDITEGESLSQVLDRL